MNRCPQQDEIRDAYRRAPDRDGCDPGVVPSDLDLVSTGKRLYTRQQRCQFFGYGREQDCVVDPEIGVGDTVTHRSHRRPGNVGVGYFEFFGEVPHGFAHDLVGPHNASFRRPDRLPASSLRQIGSGSDRRRRYQPENRGNRAEQSQADRFLEHPATDMRLQRIARDQIDPPID